MAARECSNRCGPGTRYTRISIHGGKNKPVFAEHYENTAGEGNQYILPKAVGTRMPQSKTDATKEQNYTVLKVHMSAVRVADPMERSPIMARTAEGKTKWASKKEPAVDHHREPLLPEAALNGQESNRLLAEPLHSAEFDMVFLKHKLSRRSDYSQSNQSVQPRISSNSVQCSIIIFPITVSSIICPGHILISLLRVGDSTDRALTMPPSCVNTSIIGPKRRGSLVVAMDSEVILTVSA